MEKSFNHHETEPASYEFFEHPQERQELFDYSKAVAEYLRIENIPNLVIIDRSARPLYVGVKEYLRSKYPDERTPNIYFMNPKGFKAKEDLTPEEIEDIIEACRWHDDIDETSDQARSREEIMTEFQNTYKRLISDKDKPVLVFDTCIHSGNSLESVKKAFDSLGFSDVRVGAVNPSNDFESQVKTDFYITKKEPKNGCYPFSEDRIIEKTFKRVQSQETKEIHRREKSRRLRKEIKRIMNDFLTADK